MLHAMQSAPGGHGLQPRSVAFPSFSLALLLTFALAACGPRPASKPGATAKPPATASPASPAQSATLAVTVTPYAVAGWWDGQSWVLADGSVPVPVKGGETYTVLHPDQTMSTARGSKPEEGCETNPGTTRVKVAGLDAGAPSPSLALSGVANPKPRPVAVLSPAAVIYRQAAGALLRKRGIDDPDADVVQVLRSDLEGDGRDEIVVVAERIADKDLFARVGDYSLVFVRRVVNEVAVTTVLGESIPVSKPGETPFVLSRRVAAVADFNGDARMEIALANRYYEGAGIDIHELKADGSIPVVMRGACGA